MFEIAPPDAPYSPSIQACREFINRNKATGTTSTKSPELVAKYADSLLKKSNKAGEEADLEVALKNVVSLRCPSPASHVTTKG